MSAYVDGVRYADGEPYAGVVRSSSPVPAPPKAVVAWRPADTPGAGRVVAVVRTGAAAAPTGGKERREQQADAHDQDDPVLCQTVERRPRRLDREPAEEVESAVFWDTKTSRPAAVSTSPPISDATGEKDVRR